MRSFVEQFDQMANPHNADIVIIAHAHELNDCMFTSGKWGVEGLRRFPIQKTGSLSNLLK
jgi:hypothetical protein